MSRDGRGCGRGHGGVEYCVDLRAILERDRARLQAKKAARLAKRLARPAKRAA